MVVIAMDKNKEVELIMAKIDPLFKRLMHTRYWLQIANNPYDHCYDFFLIASGAVNQLDQWRFTPVKLMI